MTHFGYLIDMREKENERRQNTKVVIKGDERELESTPLGQIRWYMHPELEDTPVQFYLYYVQEIAPHSRSGKLRVPGGHVIYYWEGTGHTILDEETFNWKPEDVLQIPVRPDGTTFQHFNDGDTTAKLIVAEPNYLSAMGVQKGSTFEVLENAPEYK